VMRIWMPVDLEPGYERPHVGDRIEATTAWCRRRCGQQKW
jgi:hypothetical protein